MKRYLVHGPCLNDLNELLFFDAWICRFVVARVRPRTLAPGYVGDAVNEPWPKAVLDALEEARRALSPGDVVWCGEAADADGAPKTPLDLVTAMGALVEQATALVSDAIVPPLLSPANNTEVVAWLTAIDQAARSTAIRLGEAGHRATGKQYADGITRVYRPGWELVLAVVMPSFPRIDRALADMGNLLAFLDDATTRIRREAVHAWPTLLGRAGLPPAAVVQHLTDAVAEYAAWVEALSLASGRGRVELLWKLDDPAQASILAEVPLTDAARAVVHLRPRGLSVGEAADARSDTPMALVCHRARGYP